MIPPLMSAKCTHGALIITQAVEKGLGLSTHAHEQRIKHSCTACPCLEIQQAMKVKQESHRYKCLAKKPASIQSRGSVV